MTEVILRMNGTVKKMLLDNVSSMNVINYYYRIELLKVFKLKIQTK